MTSSQVRLHRKLYRAGAIDGAIKAAKDAEPNAAVRRERDGEHHVVSISGVAPDEARNLALEVADLSLRLTVDADKK